MESKLAKTISLTLASCPICKKHKREGKLLPFSKGVFHGHNIFTSASSDLMFAYYKCSNFECKYEVGSEYFCYSDKHKKSNGDYTNIQKIWNNEKEDFICPECYQ